MIFTKGKGSDLMHKFVTNTIADCPFFHKVSFIVLSYI